MNLADLTRWQDNINKVLSQEGEYNLLSIDRVTDISSCDHSNEGEISTRRSIERERSAGLSGEGERSASLSSEVSVV